VRIRLIYENGVSSIIFLTFIPWNVQFFSPRSRAGRSIFFLSSTGFP
jgi:hypothetical protein